MASSLELQLIDASVSKKTQEQLGGVIKKPALTEKLLSKPPFRFLHDIIISIISTTGLMDGLFSKTEMNAENIKDRDSKIAFLQKAVDFVSLINGDQLHAKPARIVAGQEPEKTNEFLQSLAQATTKKADNADCVKRVLALHANKAKSTSDDKDDGSRERKANASVKPDPAKTGTANKASSVTKPATDASKTAKQPHSSGPVKSPSKLAAAAPGESARTPKQAVTETVGVNAVKSASAHHTEAKSSIKSPVSAVKASSTSSHASATRTPPKTSTSDVGKPSTPSRHELVKQRTASTNSDD